MCCEYIPSEYHGRIRDFEARSGLRVWLHLSYPSTHDELSQKAEILEAGAIDKLAILAAQNEAGPEIQEPVTWSSDPNLDRRIIQSRSRSGSTLNVSAEEERWLEGCCNTSTRAHVPDCPSSATRVSLENSGPQSAHLHALFYSHSFEVCNSLGFALSSH